MVTYPLFFLSLVFLLFPLAHLRLIEGVPVYLSEIPLLFVLAWFATSPTFFQNLMKFVSREKWIIGGGILFLVGATLPFFFQTVPDSSLGLLKSFIVLPLMLMITVGILGHEVAAQRRILSAWWLGIFVSALVGTILLLEDILTYDGRLASLYASPNHFAMLLSPGVFIGPFLFRTAVSKWRWFYILGTCLILIALLATRSYASIVAVTFVSLFWGVPCKRSGAFSWKPIALTVFLVAGWLFLEGTTTKFQSILDFGGRSSSASRLMIWESAWKMSQDSFPVGIGIGRFQEVYLEYQRHFPPYLEWAVPEPHNLLLSLFLSTGLMGLLGFFIATIGIGKKLWQACFGESNPLFGQLYFSLLSWILLVGLVDTPYFKNDLSFLFWGVVGLSLAFLAGREKKQTTG